MLDVVCGLQAEASLPQDGLQSRLQTGERVVTTRPEESGVKLGLVGQELILGRQEGRT